jgi:hypothetical protein
VTRYVAGRAAVRYSGTEHQRLRTVSNANSEPPEAHDRDAIQFLVYLVAAACAGIAFFGLMAEFGKNAPPALPKVPVEINKNDFLPKLPKLEGPPAAQVPPHLRRD